MASAIPRRAQRIQQRGAMPLRAWPDTPGAKVTAAPAAQATMVEPSVDVFRLMLAFVGLTTTVGIPGVVVAWLASDFVQGLGRRVLELWP